MEALMSTIGKPLTLIGRHLTPSGYLSWHFQGLPSESSVKRARPHGGAQLVGYTSVAQVAKPPPVTKPSSRIENHGPERIRSRGVRRRLPANQSVGTRCVRSFNAV